MKAAQIEIFLEEFNKLGMTPNEYFSLYLFEHDRELPKRVNKDLVHGNLRLEGWIDGEFRTTEKFREAGIFGEQNVSELIRNVEIYRQMWPSITLPTGTQARSPNKDLQKRFKWFLENYDYSWETILKATEMYISHYRDQRYAFMRNSAFFIFKSEGAMKNSTLASWCDRTLIEDKQEDSFDINV